MKVKTPGCCGNGSGMNIQDEGSFVGATTTLNFVGDNVQATDAGNGVIEVNFNGQGGDTIQYRGDWAYFETQGFPVDADLVGSGALGVLRLGDKFRLVFNDPSQAKTINGIDYFHNYLIEYAGSGNWMSYSANYGN